jgi:hypothetical protein
MAAPLPGKTFGFGHDTSFLGPHQGKSKFNFQEADYVRSTLPNGGSNTQHDLRLAAGISFHFED